MAGEVTTARENTVRPLNSVQSATKGRRSRTGNLSFLLGEREKINVEVSKEAHGGVEMPSMNGRSAKIPKGKKLNYDDDIVTVYDEKGKKVSEGMWDYSPYNNDETYDIMKWDDTAKNYKLAHGYRMVVKK